ncbi:MAG: YigZ family protein, partial [Bacteroidota bacterium]
MATPIEDSFFTISKKAEGEFKDKGSRFIAIAYPFDNIDLLKTYLIETKTIHPKARHFCYAYKIGMDSENSRSNDDGEPSGSAGKPILNAILSKNLSNILIIVVRYFGGTLLGVPGLINAYKS